MGEPVDELRQLVLGDPELCRSLAEVTDRREFTARVTAVARAHGMALDPGDIDGALVAARRLWLERWV